MEDIIRLLYAEDDPELGSFYPDVIGGKRFLCRNCRGWIPDPEIFQQIKPDMVLLDIDMPGKNGWDLICESKTY